MCKTVLLSEMASFITGIKKITMDIPEARSLKVTVTLLVESLVASLPGFTGRWS